MKKIVLSAFAIAMCLGATAQLDGWTKGKGNTELALGATFEQGTGFYAGTEKVDLTRTKIVATVFAVRGITDNLDVILNVPYVNISGGGGLQDIAGWLKWAPVRTGIGANWNMSLVAAVGFSAPMTNYNTETISAIGQANTAFMPTGLLQFQNNNSGFFFNVSSGYHFKSEPTPDLVPFQFKVGLAKAKYYLEAYFDMGESQGGKDYRGTGDLAAESFKELGASWQKVGVKFYKPLHERYGISADVFKVISGRNYDDSFCLLAAFIFKIPSKKQAKADPE